MQLIQPRAITMWDFSWLERRWPGAGYEDIEQALDELVERGYDAVRIDAYPHLIFNDPEAEYELLPVWGVNDWGAPMRCKVRNIQKELLDFIRACAERGVAVALSSWFRRDTGESWRWLSSPEKHAEAWSCVLQAIAEAGLSQHILYCDLCNEWPLRVWAPFFYGQDMDAAAVADAKDVRWHDTISMAWLQRATSTLRNMHPEIAISTSLHPWNGEHSDSAAEICDFSSRIFGCPEANSISDLIGHFSISGITRNLN